MGLRSRTGIKEEATVAPGSEVKPWRPFWNLPFPCASSPRRSFETEGGRDSGAADPTTERKVDPGGLPAR